MKGFPFVFKIVEPMLGGFKGTPKREQPSLGFPWFETPQRNDGRLQRKDTSPWGLTLGVPRLSLKTSAGLESELGRDHICWDGKPGETKRNRSFGPMRSVRTVLNAFLGKRKPDV